MVRKSVDEKKNHNYLFDFLFNTAQVADVRPKIQGLDKWNSAC